MYQRNVENCRKLQEAVSSELIVSPEVVSTDLVMDDGLINCGLICLKSKLVECMVSLR